MRVAVLDDYQQRALSRADWSRLGDGAQVTAFKDHLFDEDALVQRLQGFDVVVGMRERTPFRRSLLERLPNLKLLMTTGMGNASYDFAAATELGIPVAGTSMGPGPVTAELTWGLILSLVRRIPREDAAVRAGGWQLSLGEGLYGKTLGIVGLGRLGTAVARVGLAFQMKVIAWSQNLTRAKAETESVGYATKEQLFRESDIISIHYVLSDRSRDMIGASELGLMKPTAYLINTSRGPIVNEAALVAALSERKISGAGLDVFDVEPLPPDHPLRRLPNTVITPHLGYVTQEAYTVMFTHAIENILTWLAGDPTRIINPAVFDRPNLRRP
ncbi:MAG: D-2-hydroxyacid dehydrogenase family protein [Chloroflexi bacterium]|nr:D-2-hydroxyacid dehydrogenase family protein [Chloroflexota bacterium]